MEDPSATRALEADENVLVVSGDELAFVSDAITESLMAIEEWEYHTRLGATREEAEALRGRLKQILRHAPDPSR